MGAFDLGKLRIGTKLGISAAAGVVLLGLYLFVEPFAGSGPVMNVLGLAPVVAIFAYDLKFPDHLPRFYHNPDAKTWYTKTPEHTAETATSPQAIWHVLADLDQWATWDTSMDWVRLQGPFQAGSEVVMKPKGQDPITSVIVEETSWP